MSKKRKIFFVVASGSHNTGKHYRATIKNKRTVEEISTFLTSDEEKKLKDIYRGRSYCVWGATPGPGNIRNWKNMTGGDYLMIYRAGKIILTAEVAAKIHNPKAAEYFWGRDEGGDAWEYIYFLINEEAVSVEQSKLNKYLGYEGHYKPRGFTPIKQKKADKLLLTYGDLLSLLKRIGKGYKLEEIDFKKQEIINKEVDKAIKKSTTEHDEMQWRLIRLGNKAKFKVWVPKADQNITYQGNCFKDFVMPEFREKIDVPTYVKNIDAVWNLGAAVRAAFEVEHSTSIFSGILRLSDLRSLAPNSIYPMFIVADRDKKNRVFKQLQRPTFSNDYLRLDEAISFLSYNSVRKLDNETKETKEGLDVDWLMEKAEKI